MKPASQSISRRRRPWVAGALLILAAFLVSRTSLEQSLASDELIQDPRQATAILVGRAALLLLGSALILLPGARRISLTVRGVLGLAGIGLAVIGAYGYGLWFDWLQPRTPDPPELCRTLSKGDAPFFGSGRMERLQRAVAGLEGKDVPATRRISLKAALAGQLLRSGRVTDAIAEYREALAQAEDAGLPGQEVNALRRALGVAYLRGGEIRHCIAQHNPDNCLFPIRGGGVHRDPGPARQAIELFDDYLEVSPGDPAGRWLLNLAHMAAGSWPEGVGEGLIPPATFEPEIELPRFQDIAPGLGLDTVNLLGGAVVDDFDGDGLLDIISSTNEPCGSMVYFGNRGDGTFENRTEGSGVEHQNVVFNVIHGDYDGDGRLDLFLTRGAWLGAHGRFRNSLLRQEADGTFRDVTRESGLGRTAYPTLAAAWGDFDGDGDLDLYVGNERLTPRKVSPSQLFLNNGDGTFTDIARRAGVVNRGSVKGVNWGDPDNDGDLDLFVSNLGEPNRLYRNDGDGTFTDIAPELGIATTPPENRTFGAWFWDYDNDGWLDLFVAGYPAAGLDAVAAGYLGTPVEAETLHLYRNDGTGGFDDMTGEVGLDRVLLPMAANYGDLDRDGFPDLYLGTGSPPFESLVPNVLLMNRGAERFLDASAGAGVGHLQKGHGVAFGDLDNDGDLDLFLQVGGFLPDDAFANSLFLNPGFPGHWLQARLIGTRSNTFGVGARVRASVVEEDGARREIHGQVGGGGSFGGSSFRLFLGLGGATRIEALEIGWPGGALQALEDLPVDRFLEIVEGEEKARVVERPPIRWVLAADD